MGLVGWTGLPGKFVEVGGEHTVKTDRGDERLRCASAGGRDARFIADEPGYPRVVVVPREEWADRILDLRDEGRIR